MQAMRYEAALRAWLLIECLEESATDYAHHELVISRCLENDNCGALPVGCARLGLSGCRAVGARPAPRLSLVLADHGHPASGLPTSRMRTSSGIQRFATVGVVIMCACHVRMADKKSINISAIVLA